ncbi:MAG: PD-(D/E)XK nuclease family protein [Erysipelotrichaceae bacterium]|nr:PD-(D/E)XK nuclease family protein [Erysipelotrichaceae bacterium]
MNKQNISTILASFHYHPFLYQQLLKKHSSQSLFGIQLSSWDTLANKGLEFEASPGEEFHQIYQLLQEHKHEVPTFQTMLDYPIFVQELISRYNDFVRYQISLEELPTTKPSEIELKHLFSLIHSLPLRIHKQVQNMNQLTANELTIAVGYIPSLYQQNIINRLIDQGAQMLPIFHAQKPTVKLMKAQNMRQEVEAVAQWIIQNQTTLPLEQIQLVILQKDYLPYLSQIFQRYEIPIDFRLFSQPSLIVQKMIALLQFIQQPNQSSLISLLNHQFWKLESSALAEYLSFYMLSFDDCLSPFNHVQNIQPSIIDQRDLHPLVRLETQAEQQRVSILPLLEILLSDCSVTDKIIVGFQHLLNDPLLEEKEEAQAFQKAKDMLQVLLYRNASLPVLLSQISKIEKHYPTTAYASIMVTTVDQLLPDYTHTIVLGCTQNNFPKTSNYTGAIDETYLAKIKRFPSKEERVNHYFQQMETLYQISPNIIFSYSSSNLQGKSYELSIEMEQRYGKDAQDWPLVQVDTFHHDTHTLSFNNASALFLRNGKLHGSVSSFERYQNCQYAYFLERGCKLQPNEPFVVDHRILGTLQHAIVEHFVSYQSSVSASDIQSFIHPYFQEIIDVLPHQKDYIHILEQQMVNRMATRIEYLQQINKQALMKPVAFEKEIQVVLPTKPVPIELRGIIDRIDASQDYFRIIDYKSSNKSLTDGKFEAGLQLQLLTYLYVAEKLYDKRAFGAYYVSLQTNNSDDAFYGAKDKETKQQFPITALEQEWNYLKNNSASGWQMEHSIDEQLTQPLYFKAKEKDWPLLKQKLFEIYQALATSICEGYIQTNPTENTCQYCHFLSICRYHGETRKISARNKKEG